MLLRETQSKWGNLYKRRYFLNGKRISESLANYYLKQHAYEQLESGKDGNGNWVIVWNIGPRLDTMHDLYDDTMQQMGDV